MTPASDALALLSSITYGAADFLGGLATRRGSNLFSVIVGSQAAGLILVLLALPLLPAAAPAGSDLVWGGAGGLAGGIGLALLYRGLAIGVMSVIAPVTAVCAVIVPVFVAFALSERVAAIAVLGIVLAIGAIVLISQTAQIEDGKRARAGLTTAIVSGIAIGVFLVCLERTGPAAGLWPLVAARFASISLFAVAGAAAQKRLVPERANLALVLAGGALDMTANILYLLAVRQGSLAIVATLTSLYPASTILLARLLLRERLRPLQQAGVACALVAIALIVARG